MMDASYEVYSSEQGECEQVQPDAFQPLHAQTHTTPIHKQTQIHTFTHDYVSSWVGLCAQVPAKKRRIQVAWKNTHI